MFFCISDSSVGISLARIVVPWSKYLNARGNVVEVLEPVSVTIIAVDGRRKRSKVWSLAKKSHLGPKLVYNSMVQDEKHGHQAILVFCSCTPFHARQVISWDSKS